MVGHERHEHQHETVGIDEAKTRLCKLIHRVSEGVVFIITRHGTPVARLIPAEVDAVDVEHVARVLAGLRKLGAQTGFDLSQEELRSAIDEGRMC